MSNEINGFFLALDWDAFILSWLGREAMVSVFYGVEGRLPGLYV